MIRWLCWFDTVNNCVYMDAYLYRPYSAGSWVWFIRSELPPKCTSVMLEEMIQHVTLELNAHRTNNEKGI